MKRFMTMIAAAAACVLSIAAPAVADDDDRSITVNCNAGKTIGAVLAKKAEKNRPLVLRVLGTCIENITINRDDVTLEGEVGATIQGGVVIDRAQRAVVAELTITSSAADGVLVTNGSTATVRDNLIKDSPGYGIFVRRGSSAVVDRNQVRNNGLNIAQGNAGIGVQLNSTVQGVENMVEDNFTSGLQVFDNSSYRSDGDIFKASTAAPPVGVTFEAVTIFRSGYADLRRATVTGPAGVNSVTVTEQSQLQVRGVVLPDNTISPSTITSNIFVDRLSFLRLRDFVNFAGTVSVNRLSAARSVATMTCNGVPVTSCQQP